MNILDYLSTKSVPRRLKCTKFVFGRVCHGPHWVASLQRSPRP